MKERIREFMDYRKLSPSELADIIGVQRSNVSHVLSGRNNPGSAFIEKLLHSFPELNARWLILGAGQMITGQETPPPRQVNNDLFTPPVKQETPEVPRKPSNESNISRPAVDSKIERIIIFHTDKTFSEYRPGS
jgi:transcriptional regulator with XRE-family HTH domain